MIELKRHNTFKLKIGSRPLQHDVDHVIAIKKHSVQILVYALT